MSRPAGVTAAAVVQVLGSLFCLVVAAAMIVSMRGPTAPPGAETAVLIVGAVYAAFGALGIATAVGLFRVRPWARVSTLVFAGFMGLVSITAALGLVLMKDVFPAATGTAVSKEAIVMGTAGVMMVPLAIAVWWLIYFTRTSVRDAFAGVDATPPLRPLSISIIGWIYVITSVGSIVPIAMGLPAYLFGAVLTGYGATVMYVLMGAIGGSLGWGLLQLREQARVFMLAWLGFTGAHLAFMALVPGQFEKMQAASPQPFGTQPEFVPGQGFVAAMMVPSIVLVALAAWFLVKEKAAFTRDGAPGA